MWALFGDVLLEQMVASDNEVLLWDRRQHDTFVACTLAVLRYRYEHGRQPLPSCKGTLRNTRNRVKKRRA